MKKEEEEEGELCNYMHGIRIRKCTCSAGSEGYNDVDLHTPVSSCPYSCEDSGAGMGLIVTLTIAILNQYDLPLWNVSDRVPATCCPAQVEAERNYRDNDGKIPCQVPSMPKI